MDRFSGYATDIHKNVNAMCFQVLEDKEGIITFVIQEVLKDYCNIDSLKINYLADTEFMKMFNKAKRYYIETNKMLKYKEDKELEDRLKTYFEYNFNNCDSKDVKAILNAMSTQTFKNAAIEDLRINTSLDRYKDFDKIYIKTLNEFKRLHKDVILENEEEQSKIGFGWRLYAVVKTIETLFKL